MADISMCYNKDCLLKENCHRFTAPITTQWQAYSDGIYDKETNTCKDFWDNTGYEKDIAFEKENPAKRIRIKKIKKKK